MNQKILLSSQSIKIEINKKNKEISKKGRRIFTNPKLDYTCVEIFDDDEIDYFYFVDDFSLNNNFSGEKYINKLAIIFAIIKNESLGLSNGLIKNIKDQLFLYTCNTFPGSSGGVILDQITNCIVGIHKGECNLADNKGNINVGIFIRSIIDDMNNNKESNLEKQLENNNNIIINNNNINNNSNNNINNNVNNIINKKNIKIDFPPLIGLQNVGAIPYMNATLQCFCQIEELVNYFKYKHHVNEVIQKYDNINALCLTKSFKNLIENLWPSKYEYIDQQHNHQNSSNKYFAPHEFKEKISDMDPHFRGVQANDSKDLVDFIIMKLHEELNKAEKNNIISNYNSIFDKINKKLVLKIFAENFINENKSIISDLFYGVLCITTKCLGCQIEKYNFQTEFFMTFSLEEVRKKKIELLINQYQMQNQNVFNTNPTLYQLNLTNYKNNIQKIDIVDIKDCFYYAQNIQLFTGENSLY